MSNRARRRAKQRGSPFRRHWLSITIVAAIIVVAVGGGYEYSIRGASTLSSSVTTTTSTTCNTNGNSTGDYAVIDTSQGQIVVQLFPEDAPQTVANFQHLANTGFYCDLVWHRIVSGFVIQTGDPNTRGAINSSRDIWGQGGSGTTIPFENNSLPNNAGYVAMARGSSLDSASSQFYINLAPNTSLNGQYAVFGQVISGMNVVDALAALPVYTNSAAFTYDQPINAQDALLISVTIVNTPP